MKTNKDINYELVFKGQNNQVLTNSLLVAEKFGKEHSDVLRAIDALVSKMAENQCEGYFAETSVDIPQPNGGVRDSRVVIMNRDGFTLLVMGFTGKKALQFKLDYIAAFNAMEKQLKVLSTPQTYAEALRRLADEVEEKERTKALLEQKTEQLDESKEWYSIKRWAKEHGMNWRSINWRKMKALSYELAYDIKKVFDANYGQVNIYNVKVFEAYL